MSDAERARLSSFVKSLDAETKAGNLFVTGYTCDLGSKDHNDDLAIEEGGGSRGLSSEGRPARYVGHRHGQVLLRDKRPG